MVFSPSNHHKPFLHAGRKPLLGVDEIDAGAARLQAPKIRPARSTHNDHAHASNQRRAGAITRWETPYNRPAFETPENIQYTRLALQYLQQGRIEDAERLYKQALIVAERTFKDGDPAIFRAIEDLAGFYYRHEKYQQAEPLVSRLLKQRVERLCCDDWLLIRTVEQLADIYEKCGRPVQAQALYKLLLARQEETVGRDSTICAFTLSRLADSYIKEEHYSAAETLHLRILSIQQTVYGRSSIEISTTLQELSKIYQKLGRYDKAAEMLERLLHVLEAIHGDNGLSVASCLLKLADLLTEVEMIAEAEPLYRRAQDIYRLSYGDRTAAHSVFKKKLERVTGTISKLSKDKPADQEQCSRFPAIRINLDDMLPSKLGTGQVNRCLGHGVSSHEETQIDEEESHQEPEMIQAVQTSQTIQFAPPQPQQSFHIDSPKTADTLDSILDPLFVSELSKIYETTLELPSDEVLTRAQLRQTVRERPLLMPEPFPTSRKRTATQTMFAVPIPNRASL